MTTILCIGISALVIAVAAGVYAWLRGSYRAADELQDAIWRSIEKQQRSKT